MTDSTKLFKQLIDQATKIAIIQASNPDADSLGSALGLGQLLEEQGKQVSYYCNIPVPKFLQFVDGWQKIQTNLASDYQLAIIVDCSALGLLDPQHSPDYWQDLLAKNKLIVLDHHGAVSDSIKADLVINEPAQIATGQLIYGLASQLDWSIKPAVANRLAAAILADSLGFSSQAMKDNPQPLRVVADLVELGADLPQQYHQRLQQMQITTEELGYRAKLLQRIEFLHHNQLALLTIPYDEIKLHKGNYNPTIVLDEMRLVEGVKLTAGIKQYTQDGRLIRITVRLRCHGGCQVAQKLATYFDGGGHPGAAGLKWSGYDLDFDSLKAQLVTKAIELLEEEANETQG